MKLSFGTSALYDYTSHVPRPTSSGPPDASKKLKTGLIFVNGGSQKKLLLFPAQRSLTVFCSEWLISLRRGAAVHMLSTLLVPIWFYL